MCLVAPTTRSGVALAETRNRCNDKVLSGNPVRQWYFRQRIGGSMH
jgi:hypothetical protein